MTKRSFSGISFNTATFLGHVDLRETVRYCQDIGYSGISPTFDEIDRLGGKQARHLFGEAGLRVTGLNPSQIMAVGSPQADKLFCDYIVRSLQLASEIQADCLVVVVGGVPLGDKANDNNYTKLLSLLAGLQHHAQVYGVPIGIEPLHPTFASERSIVCDLETAITMANFLGNWTGVILDTYHIWWDVRLKQILGSTAPQKILGVHVNDWKRESTDRLYDRGMIGEGVIDHKSIFAALTEIKYDGYVEAEVISKALSQTPYQTMKTAYQMISNLIS